MPDVVEVVLGVSVRRTDASTAIADASSSAAGVLAAVAASGIDQRDVRTIDYSITQEYRYPPDGQPQADGFRVSNVVSVIVRDVERAGHVIAAAAAAAAGDVVVNGISFRLEDAAAATAAARVAAFEDARATAGQLAELAGRRLGTVEWIDERPPAAGWGGPRLLAAKAADAGPPIAAGEVSASVDVEVRWSFAD